MAVERRSKLRGTTAQLNAMAGPTGLLAVDRSNYSLRLFDGVLLGGYHFLNRDQNDARYAPIGRLVNTENGITGGGDLGSDRTLGLTGQASDLHNWDKAGLLFHEGGAGDYQNVVIDDTLEYAVIDVGGTPTLALGVNLSTTLDGVMFVAAHEISSGDGLTQTGSIAAGGEIALSVDSTIARSAITLTAGDGLSGGGNLTANRSFSVDSTVVRTSRTVAAGNGLTGGGDLSANRTITLGTPSDITATSSNSVTATSHTHFIGNAAVRDLIAISAAGAVGMYAFLRPTEAVAWNEIYDGGKLRRSDANNKSGTVMPSGTTWRCLGACDAGVATLFLRLT